MKWPRGKYTKWRIVGFNVSLSVKVPRTWDDARWLLVPRISFASGAKYFIWLLFTLRFDARYAREDD